MRVRLFALLLALGLVFAFATAVSAQNEATHEIVDANGDTFQVAAPFTVDTVPPGDTTTTTTQATTTTTTTAPGGDPLPSGRYPIVEFGELRAFDYPRAADDVCDPESGYVATVGTELRIEQDVIVADRPSEHWTLRWQIGPLTGFDRDGTARLNYTSAVLIRHQNAGPDYNTSAHRYVMEPLQWNEKLRDAGPHVIDFEVVGDETGLIFHNQCVFTVEEAVTG